MKVVFITKSLCHHQLSLADSLFHIYGSSFSFIQCREPLDFRVEFNQEGFERPYLIHYSKDDSEKAKALKHLENADVVICGEAPWQLIKNTNRHCYFFLYSEHIFKKGYYKYGFLSFVSKIILGARFAVRLKRFKKKYLLAASGFAVYDYYKFGLFKEKAFKWGYFPSAKLELKAPNNNGDIYTFVWASRLLKWKHPEVLIRLSLFLKENNINHQILIAGDGDNGHGEMLELMKNSIERNNLSDSVFLLGKLTPDNVKDLYKKSDFAIFTSDDSEGWGVGVNEAFSSSTVCIVSSKCGCAPFLCKNLQNCYIYNFNKESSLFKTVLFAINHKEINNQISFNAYDTIKNEWNASVAAERFASVLNKLRNNENPFFDNGPCSKADVIDRNWYKYEN